MYLQPIRPFVWYTNTHFNHVVWCAYRPWWPGHPTVSSVHLIRLCGVPVPTCNSVIHLVYLQAVLSLVWCTYRWFICLFRALSWASPPRARHVVALCTRPRKRIHICIHLTANDICELYRDDIDYEVVDGFSIRPHLQRSSWWKLVIAMLFDQQFTHALELYITCTSVDVELFAMQFVHKWKQKHMSIMVTEVWQDQHHCTHWVTCIQQCSEIQFSSFPR